MRQAETQKSWGWLVVFYIFLAGLGGGAFLFSFILDLVDKFPEVSRIGALVGPLAVLFGSIILIFDLGSPSRAFRMFTTPRTLATSWMIRGAWILTAFIIFGLAYALPAFSAFAWLPWSPASGIGLVFGFIAGVLALIVPIYPGLLFGVIRAIPFWNSAALPPLFFFSGLDTGVAVLGLAALLNSGVVGIAGLHLLGAVDIVLIILVLIALFTYVEIVRQSNVSAAASARLLKSFAFIGGVVIFGLLLPLALLAFGAFQSDIQWVRIVEGATAVLILLGGLLLRYTVVKSGVRLPLH